MEQLRAISFCSRPRSYRKRNTSLIFRMDRAFWDIRFLLQPEEKSPFGCPAPLSAPTQKTRSRNVNINPGSIPPLSSRVRIIHIPGISIHMPGILIHILLESLFTSPRNPYPHAPEYALAEASPFLQTTHCRCQGRRVMVPVLAAP